MLQLALTLAVVLIPFLLVLFLRTNAAILFFVLCGASTLQTYLDKDVSSFASSLMPGKNAQIVTIALFVLPFIVAAIAFRHTVTKSHLLMHLVLGLLVGGSLVFVGPQFLSPGVAGTIHASEPYHVLQPYSSIVIASAFLMSVVFLWISHPKHHDGKKHHGH